MIFRKGYVKEILNYILDIVHLNFKLRSPLVVSLVT